jgi:hypothetical protein
MAPQRTHRGQPGQPAEDGPGLLFVHGLLHGAWCWAAPWREFFDRRGFAAHWLSLAGHDGTAPSRRALRWTSLADYADCVVNAAEALAWPAVLVGHSLGAMLIQMRLRQLNPPAVVLLAPTHPAAFRRAAWHCLCHDPRLFLRVHRQGRLRLAVPTVEECREWFFSESTPGEVVSWCFERLQEESYRVCLELLLRPRVVQRARAGTPVLVLGAGRDHSVPRAVTERVAQLHGVRAEFFAEMGHDLMLDRGWEHVAERIIDWLGELGLASRHGPRPPPLDCDVRPSPAARQS